jgi:hypothetical protein
MKKRKKKLFLVFIDINENRSRRFTQIYRKFSQSRLVSLFTYTI